MAKWTILFLTVLSTIDLSKADCSSVNILRNGKLTCKDKKVILKKHNDLRSKVATGKQSGLSPAVNMLQMTWDDELAEKAQKWVENCEFEPEKPEKRKVARFSVGQNLAISWDFFEAPKMRDKPEFESVIQEWFDTVKDFKGYYTSQVGHFTQIVWGHTYLIGCGYSYFKEPGDKYTKLYVCNYGPAGNYAKQYPYTQGQTGCNSTLTKSPKFPGLCKVKKFKALRC